MVTNALYWTTADLDAMPDNGGWLRHEIITGELFVTRAPHISHQRAAGKIHMRLESWSEETQLGSSVNPFFIFCMVSSKSMFKSLCLLSLPALSLATFLSLPSAALDEKRECNLYGLYANDKLRVVYSRTNAVLDLTNTIFDPPMDRETQVQKCKKALSEAIEQQLELDLSFCPSKVHGLVGIIKSAGEITEVVRAKAVYRTGIVTDTEYRPVPMLTCQGFGRCQTVYRPIPYQVERRVSSCRLSAP